MGLGTPLKSILLLAPLAQAAIEIPQVEEVLDGIRASVHGFHLYEIVYSLDECDNDVTKYFQLWLDSVDGFMNMADLTQYEVEQAVWALTDTFGQLSYTVRSCYDAWINLSHLFYSYALRIDEFPTFALFTHDNIRERQAEIDELAWQVFLTAYTGGRWIDISFDISRLIYTLFLSEHFDRRLIEYSDGIQRDLDETIYQRLLASGIKINGDKELFKKAENLKSKLIQSSQIKTEPKIQYQSRKANVTFDPIFEDRRQHRDLSDFIGYKEKEQEKQEARKEQRRVESGRDEQPRVGTIYPLPREYLNNFHLGIEFIYEFMRGLRIVDVVFLDACEGGLAQYMIDMDHNIDFLEDAQSRFDYDDEREAVFQIIDSFRDYTPIVQGCWSMYWRIGKSIRVFAATNLIDVSAILLNLMYEGYTIISNIATIFADYFFEDWLSMAFYIGDTLHRVLITKHFHTFKLNADELLSSDITLIDHHLQ